MGLSQNVYLGPILRCKKPMVDVSTQLSQCVVPECKAYHWKSSSTETRFCSLCGSQLVVFETVTNNLKSLAGKAQEVTKDVLCLGQDSYNTDEYDLLVINTPRNMPRSFYMDQEDAVFFCLPDEPWIKDRVHIMSELAWFKANYQHEIRMVKDIYGHEDGLVTLEFGLLCWRD